MIYSTINVSGPGDIVLVAAERGYSVKVYSYLLVSSAAASIDFEDTDGTILSGPCSVGITGGHISVYSPEGNLKTAAGKGLSLGVDAAAQVGGNICYEKIYEG